MNTPNPLREIQERQFEDRLKQLKDGFALLDTVNINTIPENIFKHHFLDFFSGADVPDANYLLTNWYAIAGNNYSPVNIVDSAGKFVIQVPPIHNQNSLKTILNRREDISYTMKVAEQKASLSPKLAINLISAGLGERFQTMTDVPENDENTKQWLALFKHYGKDVSVKTDTPNTTSHSDDEFEY